MRASTQTQRTNLRRGALALACAASLAALPACSLGPVDLDALMGNGTSVAEAKAAARAARSTTLTADELHTAGTLTVGLLSSESAPLLLSSATEVPLPMRASRSTGPTPWPTSWAWTARLSP